MNRDMLEGQWTQLKGRVRERWGKLTDDDLDRIAGKRDQLIGTIQQKYGAARDAAADDTGRTDRRICGAVAFRQPDRGGGRHRSAAG